MSWNLEAKNFKGLIPYTVISVGRFEKGVLSKKELHQKLNALALSQCLVFDCQNIDLVREKFLKHLLNWIAKNKKKNYFFAVTRISSDTREAMKHLGFFGHAYDLPYNNLLLWDSQKSADKDHRIALGRQLVVDGFQEQALLNALDEASKEGKRTVLDFQQVTYVSALFLKYFLDGLTSHNDPFLFVCVINIPDSIRGLMEVLNFFDYVAELPADHSLRNAQLQRV